MNAHGENYSNHGIYIFVIKLLSRGGSKLTWTHASSHLDKKLIRRLDDTKCCRKTSRHTDHTQDIANTRRRLRRQASQCSDTAQRRSQVRHLMDVWIEASLSRIAIPTKECSRWKCIQVAVLRWVSYKHHKQHWLPIKTKYQRQCKYKSHQLCHIWT